MAVGDDSASSSSDEEEARGRAEVGTGKGKGRRPSDATAASTGGLNDAIGDYSSDEMNENGKGDDDDDDDDEDDEIASSSSDEDEGQPKGFLQGGKVDSFSRAFHRLVDGVDGLSKAPILAGSKSIHRRKEEQKLELEASKAAKKLREEMKKRGHYLPAKKGEDPQRDILEKRLQKTATKGVVQLFNAINTAQKRIRSEDTLGNKAKAAKLGKAGFLAGIRQVRERQNQEALAKGGQPEGPVTDPEGANGKWDVLKGGFVGINDNSVRMRDWDTKKGNASEDSDEDNSPSDSDDDGF